MRIPTITTFLLALLFVPALTRADTLLIERVQKTSDTALPARGSRMQNIQARYGTPLERMAPRGGQRQQWPMIDRWRYADFIVYFENGKVVDAVLLRADPTETGPKPPLL